MLKNQYMLQFHFFAINFLNLIILINWTVRALNIAINLEHILYIVRYEITPYFYSTPIMHRTKIQYGNVNIFAELNAHKQRIFYIIRD